MATIGKLSIMLTASAAQFVSGVKKAAGATAGLASKLKGIVSLGGVLKAAIGAVALGGFTAWVKNALESTAATIKLARAVGASTEGLIVLQHAIKSLGGDADAAGRGLATLNERLSGLGPEANYAQDVLSRLGLQAADLAKMPTDEAFKKIANAIAAIPDPMQRAAAATALFGEDAAALLPVLSAGGKGLDEASKRANALGLVFSSVDGANIEDANAKLDVAMDTLKGITTQIAVQLAPWILAAIDSLSNLGDSGVSVGEIVADSFKVIAKSIAYVVDALKFVGKAIQLAFVASIEIVASEWLKLFNLLAKLPDKLGGGVFKGIRDDLQNYAKGAHEIGRGIAKDMDAIWDNPPAVASVDKFFNSLEDKARRAADALKGLNKRTAGGAVGLAGRFGKILGEGAEVFKQNLTPAQKFGQEIQKLQTLVMSGAINWETYSRAVAKSVGELEKAHGLADVKLPAGLTRESSEAVSAINQQEALNNRRFRESPQERVRRVLEESLEIEKQQLDYARRLADVFKPPQKVKI